MCRWKNGLNGLEPSGKCSDIMIEVFHYSEPGGQANNEDAFAVCSLPHDPAHFLCAVADGQGGQAGGAVAAKIACEACLDSALNYSPDKLLSPEIWTKILRKADEAVADNPAAGYTTLVAFYLTEASLCGGSNGDSAAVLFHAEKPGDVLTGRQRKNPPVGSRAAAFVDFSAKLLHPWTVLAMSDGVWKYAGWENVLKITTHQRGDEIAPALRERARMQRSGGLQDDFTLVVLLSKC
jgi:hypothetical protein